MLRQATAEDVKAVLADLRPEDVKEIWKATGKPALEAIADLQNKECVAFTIFDGGGPVAIFGATRGEGGVATMFRFATKRWPEVVRDAIKIGRRVMLPMFKAAGIRRLYAETLADSDTAWLRLFGAKKTGTRVDKEGNVFNTFLVDLVA